MTRNLADEVHIPLARVMTIPDHYTKIWRTLGAAKLEKGITD